MELQLNRRQHRRFRLQQSAIVQEVNGTTREVPAVTENVSLGGMLLSTQAVIAKDSLVRTSIRLHRDGFQDVMLQGKGVVVRSTLRGSDRSEIAVKLEKPLASTSPPK